MLQETQNAYRASLSSIYRLRSTVAVVTHGNRTEFFLSDIRKTITLKIQKGIVDLLFAFDGKIHAREWIAKNSLGEVNQDDIIQLLSFLVKEHILIEVDCTYPSDYLRRKRVYAFLENYSLKTSEVVRRVEKLQTSEVMVIGLGAVGTWVAQCLAMSGVKNFILIDPDKIEISNLHRQIGFEIDDVGEYKVETFARHLNRRIDDLNINTIVDQVDEDFFTRHNNLTPNFIVNSADYPSVDITSKIVSDYAMPRGIAHAIGGGYNLHQTLIGQIVIPGKTACVECFQLELEEINVIDTANITRLDNPTRKVGSFPPLSALSASISANEIIKYLSGIDTYCMTNRRTEFNVRDMNFSTLNFRRRSDCLLCGYYGKYYQLQEDRN